MENNELTYWKNYQTAMEWVKGNTMIPEPIEMKNEDEELEFTIDEDLLDFYRHSKDHKANRSKENLITNNRKSKNLF
jgi:hypothetical protein